MGERGTVLVAGAINTDLVARVHRAPEAGETVTGTAFNVFGGGKGANQALSAARSGAAVVMLGAVGDDDFGRQRLADLRADDIDVESVIVSAEVASGVALIVVDDAGENRISYVPGATLTIAPEAASAAFRRAAPTVVMTTLELPGAALRSLYEEARAAGVAVVLNATPEPVSGTELVPLADVLIVNETEALELIGEKSSGGWPGVAHRLSALGPRTVVITLGAAGAIALIGGSLVRVAAPPVSVVDTTGAGDAFCGAFAARLSHGSDELAALKAGIAAGSLAVTIEGAQRSMPHRTEVDRIAATLSAESL